MLTKCFLTEVDEDTDQENNFQPLLLCGWRPAGDCSTLSLQ